MYNTHTHLLSFFPQSLLTTLALMPICYCVCLEYRVQLISLDLYLRLSEFEMVRRDCLDVMWQDIVLESSDTSVADRHEVQPSHSGGSFISQGVRAFTAQCGFT